MGEERYPSRRSNIPLEFRQTIDNQKNGLETQAKALMASVIRPDTLYFNWNFEYISGLCTYIFKKGRSCLQNCRLFKLFLEIKKAENHH